MARPNNNTGGYSSNNSSNSNNQTPAEAWLNLTLVINGEEYSLPTGIPLDASRARGTKQKQIVQLLLDKAKQVTEAGEETFELKVDSKIVLRPTPSESDKPVESLSLDILG